MAFRARALLLSATLALAGALLLPPGVGLAQDTSPKPIPGGIDVGGGEIIHLFVPGPVELGLMGENVEPSTITDFDGFTAMGYVNGTATDAEGNSYTMATDMRVFRGTYVAEDGSVQSGTFVFI